ncbi:MAG: hypothetical protein JOZ97_05850 [Candidatus Eremiobacteraeota bacterium]|nr:hypothetical protein [Candidatus Eremiobacteraeota bacterium]
MSLRANLIAQYMPDSGPAFPGTTTDSLGDVFVSGATPLTGPWPILEFSALASGNLQTASFGSDASGVAIGPDGNLYVPNFNALIDVYLPSAFHNGGTKDHSIALPSGIAPGAIAFDSTHTLLVIGAKGSVLPTLYLLSLPPPYSVVSTMVQIASDSSSIAIAP